jgi:acyl carrier protein
MNLDKTEIERMVIDVIGAVISHWQLDLDEPLTCETRLNEDLCFSSVDVMTLFGSIDIAFSSQLPYEKLILIDGEYRSELTIRELTEFVHTHQGAQKRDPEPM